MLNAKRQDQHTYTHTQNHTIIMVVVLLCSASILRLLLYTVWNRHANVMGWCGTILFVGAALLSAIIYQQYRNLAAPFPLNPPDTRAYWGAGSATKYKESTLVQAFTVSYANSALIADLQTDLKRPLKLVAPLEGVAFEYGVNSVALQEIVRYWRDDYLPRWEQREKFLNQFTQFKTQIQGYAYSVDTKRWRW